MSLFYFLYYNINIPIQRTRHDCGEGVKPQPCLIHFSLPLSNEYFFGVIHRRSKIAETVNIFPIAVRRAVNIFLDGIGIFDSELIIEHLYLAVIGTVHFLCHNSFPLSFVIIVYHIILKMSIGF